MKREHFKHCPYLVYAKEDNRYGDHFGIAGSIDTIRLCSLNELEDCSDDYKDCPLFKQEVQRQNLPCECIFCSELTVETEGNTKLVYCNESACKFWSEAV